jgi:hypothetical protein
MSLNERVRGIELPKRMERLAIDRRGFPVPWFASWVNGEPDFRVIDRAKIEAAHHAKVCWICGGKLSAKKAFVIGPMCAVNRISSEPPAHRECAHYAALACPFLSQPRARRNDKDLPDGKVDPAGMIQRNPGVTLIWVTRSYERVAVTDASGRRYDRLFHVGEPIELHWWREGRPATRDEVWDAIESGLPYFVETAGEAPTAEQIADLERLLPVE